nr:hypothetical protein [Tanacetum cinerariifolium]
MGYSFYYPPENKDFVVRNAKILENSLIVQEASGSLEDLKIIQEEDMHSSLDTSLNHKEDDQEIDEPQSDINPIRTSARTRHALDRMCLYIDAEEHELGDLSEPVNYKSALLDPESDKWLNAMNVEMQSMKYNKVWELVDLPPDSKTVGHKWLFKMKTTWMEQYIPIKLSYSDFIAIAAFYDYEIWKMDVKTAFLNGYLNKETGYVFVLNGGAADWKSTKQSIFATSSTYAKYIGAIDASKEAVWIRKFIYGLGVVPTIKEPINMYCDNTRAISIAKDHGVTKGARHFHAKVHYLRETIKMGDVKKEKVDTYDNLVDPFMNALAFHKHSELTEKIGMILASSLIRFQLSVYLQLATPTPKLELLEYGSRFRKLYMKVLNCWLVVIDLSGGSAMRLVIRQIVWRFEAVARSEQAAIGSAPCVLSTVVDKDSEKPKGRGGRIAKSIPGSPRVLLVPTAELASQVLNCWLVVIDLSGGSAM